MGGRVKGKKEGVVWSVDERWKIEEEGREGRGEGEIEKRGRGGGSGRRREKEVLLAYKI